MSMTLSTFIQLNGTVNWLALSTRIILQTLSNQYLVIIMGNLLLKTLLRGRSKARASLLLKIKLGKNKTYVNTSFLTIEITCAHILINTGF